MPWLRCVILTLSVGVLCACADDAKRVPQPERVRDLNEEVYGWDCDEYGYDCHASFVPESPPPPTCSEDWHPSVVWTAGSNRFFPLYVTCADDETGTWLIDGWLSRFLACESDADCPNLIFTDAEYRFECASGLCQNRDTMEFPRDILHPSEVAGLCLAGTPRRSLFEISTADADEFWAPIDESCPEGGTECRIPSGCFQL